MVGLIPQMTESVSLTRQEGEPFLLDGNSLYFTYEKKGKHETELRYGVVDLTISRKSFRVVEASEIPRWPDRQQVTVDATQVAYGLWLTEHADASFLDDYLPVKQTPYDNTLGRLISQVNLNDFRNAMKGGWPCRMYQDRSVGPAFWWDITEDLVSRARKLAQQMKDAKEAELNANWVPMRTLSAEESAKVMEIFSFDGDKKSLVTALQSWGVKVKDAEVKIDKLLTKRIILPTTLEELIP